VSVASHRRQALKRCATKVCRATDVVAGRRPAKKTCFVKTTGQQTSLVEDALQRDQNLVGAKGYVTTISATTLPVLKVIASYHDLRQKDEERNSSSVGMEDLFGPASGETDLLGCKVVEPATFAVGIHHQLEIGTDRKGVDAEQGGFHLDHGVEVNDSKVVRVRQEFIGVDVRKNSPPVVRGVQ
jgi:hypothetical protein